MAADRLSPVYANHPLDRARLMNLATVTLTRLWQATLARLGMDADARWRHQTDRDERGWRTDERQRFMAWGLSGPDAAAARTLLARHHGPAYVRHLIDTGRVGEGVPL